jgi:predicted O-methyltransferase YrrM
MTPSIIHSQVTELLEVLYADAVKNDPLIRQALKEEGGDSRAGEVDHYKRMRHVYMAVGPEFGRLLYTLVRSLRAKTVVEFGTSFGVSTIYLASAIRDNGEGKVITTEFQPEKAERAKRNLAAAGLDAWVEFRVGDVRETLKAEFPSDIDLLFLDGAKALYLDVLKLLEPRLRPGSLIASDNTDKVELEDFLKYIRTAQNGYISSAILTPERQHATGHEITIRL